MTTDGRKFETLNTIFHPKPGFGKTHSIKYESKFYSKLRTSEICLLKSSRDLESDCSIRRIFIVIMTVKIFPTLRLIILLNKYVGMECTRENIMLIAKTEPLVFTMNRFSFASSAVTIRYDRRFALFHLSYSHTHRTYISVPCEQRMWVTTPV